MTLTESPSAVACHSLRRVLQNCVRMDMPDQAHAEDNELVRKGGAPSHPLGLNQHYRAGRIAREPRGAQPGAFEQSWQVLVPVAALGSGSDRLRRHVLLAGTPTWHVRCLTVSLLGV
eukprot:200676-Chlamydomonas_euryale.AAC.2